MKLRKKIIKVVAEIHRPYNSHRIEQINKAENVFFQILMKWTKLGMLIRRKGKAQIY